MRIVILGAAGMLGRDLIAAAPPRATLVPFTRSDVDITDSSLLAKALHDAQPDIVINAAAYTAVDRAESERDLAFATNAHAVAMLGHIASKRGVRVVHFSTDYVFDGTASEPYMEESDPNPLNVYGASKLAGDNALAGSGADYLIIRTQWLFGLYGASFPRTMAQRASRRVASRVVSDQIGRPTYTPDLARVTWQLITSEFAGLINVADSGAATWYDVAKRVYAAYCAEGLVTACSSAEFPAAAKRPGRSVLSTKQLEKVIGPLPEWQQGVDQFLVQLRLNGSN